MRTYFGNSDKSDPYKNSPPPLLTTDDEAYRMTEEFIAGEKED